MKERGREREGGRDSNGEQNMDWIREKEREGGKENNMRIGKRERERD